MKIQKPIKKIAIIKLGAIGDIIMSTPLLKELKKALPDTDFDFYIGKSSLPIVKKNKSLHKVIPFDEKIMLEKKIIKLLQLCQQIRKERYDIGIMLDKSFMSGIFLRFCGIKTTVGFNRSGSGWMLHEPIIYNNNDHEITQYLRILCAFGITPPTYLPPQIDKLPKVKPAVEGKHIIIFPGGASNPGVKQDLSRKLPEKKMKEVIFHIIKKFPDYTVILHGGPTDGELNKRLSEDLNIKNITGEHSIPETIALLKHASVVICHDSGPMHMASVACPRIMSIFGSTNPKRKAPLHVKCVSLWKDKKLYQPEYDYKRTPANVQFMTTIEPEDVVYCVKILLDDTSTKKYLSVIESIQYSR